MNQFKQQTAIMNQFKQQTTIVKTNLQEGMLILEVYNHGFPVNE
jgi:hypothetical protein